MDEKIKKIIDESKPKRKVLINTLKAFLTGGIICLIAQGFIEMFEKIFNMNKEISNLYTVVIMVFLGSILTAFGLYDKIGQFGGAGTIVPITGFSNSMTSASLEGKSEGLILGIINNMFKLAGSVIVVGVVSSFVIGTIRFILKW